MLLFSVWFHNFFQLNFNKLCTISVGSAVASCLVLSSPDPAVRVRALAGDIVLCS